MFEIKKKTTKAKANKKIKNKKQKTKWNLSPLRPRRRFWVTQRVGNKFTDNTYTTVKTLIQIFSRGKNSKFAFII